ncbi:MAG: methyl-viologen-reducing hydrogenase subunit delta [Planctomycetes bacterium]|nr:methyl-viologen-reducing hydrogenase subunit delta [Planctomycetota bacterium]
MSDSVLVIGGGIAGIQASLDLAQAGARVILVERSSSIGGKMAVLDKNFPTLDCSICIEAPKMSEVGEHENIEILSPAEVVGFEGEPGRFLVRIRKQNRLVTDECTVCDLCSEACPEVLPNEFDSGMAFRKAIYTPITQSVPGAYIVDLEHCLNDPPNYLPCHRCVDACPPRCIDFDMPREEVVGREVASVIVAAGYDLMPAERLAEYGYGTHPDILTSMELERLLTSAGPTGGSVVKPSDGTHPKNVALVLCVGSRDRRFFKHCSRFCCMYSAKHAFQLMDHGIGQVTVLYMDRRAYGKGFDGFWSRTAEAGAEFVRGRLAEVGSNGSGNLTVSYECTREERLVKRDFDMVVLATAVQPSAGLQDLARTLGVQLDPDGFMSSVETRGGLVATTRPGVYAAGCVSGPKDIPDSVTEGGAASVLALGHIENRTWPEEEEAEPVTGIETPRVGVFVCNCGSNIAGVVDVKRVTEYARALTGVVYAQAQPFSCAGSTQKEIEKAIRDNAITRVVVAACSPKTHETIFRTVCRRAGLNPYLLEMANVRNQDSWVHKNEPAAATVKAMEMVAMAVEKARRLTPMHPTQQAVVQKALVIGGGVAGMTASAALARQGYEIHLVEKEDHLGGIVADLEFLAPSGISAHELVGSLVDQLESTGVRVHTATTLDEIGGFVGNFTARLSSGGELKVGAVILATGAEPYQPTEFGCDADERVLTNMDLERRLAGHNGGLPGDRVTIVGCVGARKGDVGCSRYCCASMIQQALRLARLGKKVRVLYKDIRTFGRHAEELYEEACKEGVLFFRYDPDEPPEEAIRFEDGSVVVADELSGREIRIPTDHLVLAVALTPREDTLAAQLKLARSQDGFLLELHPKLGPAETASQGIYLAGSVQSPKDVREAIAQGLAAASKASGLLAKDSIEKEPLTAKLDAEQCTGCMACVRICPFGAIEQIGEVKTGTVRVLDAVCTGCGTCAAQCNFGALDMPYFTKEQVLAQIDAALADTPEEKVLVFACNWCSYAGADQAGIEKIQYPPSSRVIRTMCSARIEKSFVERAFERGAGAVLVTGCRLTEQGSDCHYNYANANTVKRFKSWRNAMARQGVVEDRLQLQWISAAEGREFAAKMEEMHAVVQAHGQAREEEARL